MTRPSSYKKREKLTIESFEGETHTVILRRTAVRKLLMVVEPITKESYFVVHMYDQQTKAWSLEEAIELYNDC